MKALPQGRFEIIRRCLAVVDGKAYYGEVFDGQQRIFVDPAHPSLQRPYVQYQYVHTGTANSVSGVTYVQFR